MMPRFEEPGDRVGRIVRDARQVLNALIKEADRAIHRDTDLGECLAEGLARVPVLGGRALSLS